MRDSEILALFDHDERLHVRYSGLHREALERVVRHTGTDGGTGMVLYSSLDDGNADAEIEGQIAYFEGIGQDFEWKLYDHDQPHDLRQRLLKRGFVMDGDDAEALLILPLADAPERLLQPPQQDIRLITDPGAVMDVLKVQGDVYDMDYTERAQRLARSLAEAPDLLTIYAAYVDGQPVSSAWMYTSPGSRFAGMWGGATLEAYRGQGIYTALVAVRVQAARARGLPFMTIDASPMSRPIVQKLGFRLMTMTYPMQWTVSRRKG